MYRVNKKYPNTKVMISRNCANILILNFAHLFRRQLCKSVLLCAVLTYLIYVKLMETQTLRTNFATVHTVQKADFIVRVIECPITPLL